MIYIYIYIFHCYLFIVSCFWLLHRDTFLNAPTGFIERWCKWWWTKLLLFFLNERAAQRAATNYDMLLKAINTKFFFLFARQFISLKNDEDNSAGGFETEQQLWIKLTSGKQNILKQLYFLTFVPKIASISLPLPQK